MTDEKAIRQYRATEGYRDLILNSKIPEIYARDPGSLAKYRSILQRGIDKTEAELKQAEQAIERLPKKIWRDVLEYRFILGLSAEDTADALAYSRTAIMRFQQAAFKYLETGEAPRQPRRLPEGP